MIFLVNGPPQSGKTFLANSLRNTALMHRHGCLMVDDTQTGELDRLIEKLLDGANLPEKVEDIEKLPWKPDPAVIFVGAKESMLRDIEARVPGFSKKFGPVCKVDISKAA